MTKRISLGRRKEDLQNYEREIVSIQDQQCELKASITIPQSPVSIGVDAELARSHATTRRSVGKKVVNRTISFRADFHDAPKFSTGDPRKARAEASLSFGGRRTTIGSQKAPSISSPDEVGGVYTTPSSVDERGITFEERLCKWILERVVHRNELRAMQSLMNTTTLPAVVVDLFSDSETPIAALGKYIQECTHEERKEVVKTLCITSASHTM